MRDAVIVVYSGQAKSIWSYYKPSARQNASVVDLLEKNTFSRLRAYRNQIVNCSRTLYV